MYGRLGHTECGSMQYRLLMKQVWHIHNNPQLLLAKVYADHRTKPANCLPSKGNPSCGRKGLSEAEKLLTAHYGWKVGNGCTVIAAKDGWVQGSVPLFKDNVLLRTVLNTTVDTFILPTQRWNIHRIYQTFTPASARAIMGTELPRSGSTPDHFY